MVNEGNMRSVMRVWPLLAVLAASGFAAQQSEGWRKVEDKAEQKVEQKDLSEAQIQDIITRFAAKETEFARARENYTYRQTARIQELDAGGAPMGRHEIVADIIFSPEGKRTERVVRAPVSTLRNILLTPEDEADLRNVQPFVLTTAEIPKYDIRYLGKQKADEIPCYVFAVKPKKMEKGAALLPGRNLGG